MIIDQLRKHSIKSTKKNTLLIKKRIINTKQNIFISSYLNQHIRQDRR